MHVRPTATVKYKLFLAIGLVLNSLDGRAGSPCPAAPEDAEVTARQAVDAFAAMNAAEFDQARATLIEQTQCLSGPFDRQQAAEIHLVEALAAFKAKDRTRTVAELQAAHETDPNFALTYYLPVPGGPLESRDGEALARPPTARLPHGLALKVSVDGREAPDLPADWPALVVVVGATGAPVWSGVVAPGGSIPALVASAPDLVVIPPVNDASASLNSIPPLTPPDDVGKALGRTSLYAAGGMAVIAGAFTALYIPARQRVNTARALVAEDADDAVWEEDFGVRLSTDEVYQLHTRARTFEVGAQAAGGLALGLGVVGLVLVW